MGKTRYDHGEFENLEKIRVYIIIRYHYKWNIIIISYS